MSFVSHHHRFRLDCVRTTREHCTHYKRKNTRNQVLPSSLSDATEILPRIISGTNTLQPGDVPSFAHNLQPVLSPAASDKTRLAEGHRTLSRGEANVSIVLCMSSCESASHVPPVVNPFGYDVPMYCTVHELLGSPETYPSSSSRYDDRSTEYGNCQIRHHSMGTGWRNFLSDRRLPADHM